MVLPRTKVNSTVPSPGAVGNVGRSGTAGAAIFGLRGLGQVPRFLGS